MSAKQNTEKTFLVLGGNGKTGSRVVKRLLEKNYKVKIGSRSAETPFDWEDSSTSRLMTFKQAVEEIAATTGKTIYYKEISIDDYIITLREYNVPDVIINLITYLFTEVLDGRNESITDGVERALGRKPTDFSEYAKKAAKTGVWNTDLVQNH